MAPDLPPWVKGRLDPAGRYGLRLTLVGLAIVLVAVPFSILTFEVLAQGPLSRFDGRVADSFNGWVNGRPGVVSVLDVISFFGKPPTLTTWVVLAALVLWWRGRHRVAVFVVVTSLGGGIVDTLVKATVNRPRPVVDHPVASALGKSFPSGHAMSSTVTYGALLVALSPLMSPRTRRAATAFTVVLVLAVGTSRLFLGVHFVSDVLGGYLLGLAWLFGAVAAFNVWKVEERRSALRERFRRTTLPPPESPASSGAGESALPPVGLDALEAKRDREGRNDRADSGTRSG
ncbi:MAG: phosphatase PAP2 family protein [Acidimicrobiales bacterium]